MPSSWIGELDLHFYTILFADTSLVFILVEMTCKKSPLSSFVEEEKFFLSFSVFSEVPEVHTVLNGGQFSGDPNDSTPNPTNLTELVEQIR